MWKKRTVVKFSARHGKRGIIFIERAMQKERKQTEDERDDRNDERTERRSGDRALRDRRARLRRKRRLQNGFAMEAAAAAQAARAGRKARRQAVERSWNNGAVVTMCIAQCKMLSIIDLLSIMETFLYLEQHWPIDHRDSNSTSAT